MKVLVTGSSGHLGEALMRSLVERKDFEPVGIDIVPSDYTAHVGSIADRFFVARVMQEEGIEAVLHTATLQKPHVETHTRQQFVDTNVTGTLNLLEEAAKAGVKSFVFTSTTSLFGDAMRPEPGGLAVWITEEVVPKPKNIYGITKLAAENLCQLFHRLQKLNCIILRTSRFFPEEDDQDLQRVSFTDQNIKANEMLYRRVDIADIVDVHLLAISKAPSIGFGTFIVSATTPFTVDDLAELGTNAPAVMERKFPSYKQIYDSLGWKMFPTLDRVYSNGHARERLGWQPRYDFFHLLDCISSGEDPRSELARIIKPRGYHGRETFGDVPYPALQQNAS
jgi:UDP-glucose 4-epimerase